MKAKNIYFRALSLLGYTDDYGLTSTNDTKGRLIAIINAVYADLFYMENESGFTPICNDGDEVNLSEKIINDCFVFGVAMYIASMQNDMSNFAWFSNIYEHKINILKMKSQIYERKDVLPRGCDF